MILKRAIEVILRNLGLIILAAFIFAVAAGVISNFIPVDYVTKSQLMVLTYDDKAENVLDEFTVSQELAKTFTNIAQTNSVLDLVNEKLGTDYKMGVFESGAINVKNVSNVITITVTNNDPVQAKKVADAMAEALVKYVKESIFPHQDIIKVINNAYEPQKPGLRYYLLNAIKGGIGGAALMIVFFLGLDIIRASVQSSKEIKTFLNLNTLGKIKYRKNILNINKNYYEAEDFDFLRVNLRNNSEEKDKVVAVISPSGKEGKTAVCANLAANITTDDKKALLIDCNFKKPDLSAAFGLGSKAGLNVYGKDIKDYRELICETSVPNLYVIPAGEKSSGSISGTRLSQLLNELKNDYDYIIIDTPGALDQADAADFIYYADSAVIVAEYDKTSIPKIEKVCSIAQMSGTKVAGVVINKSRNSRL